MTSTTTADATPAARVKLVPLVLAAAAFAWLGDFLFWNHRPGVNAGIFAVVLAAATLATRGRERLDARVWFGVALLLGACVQTAIELCFTNIVVLLALLAVLGGGTFYTMLPRGWPRWVEQAVAFVSCATRLPWLASTWLRQRPPEKMLNPAEAASRWMMILLPGLILAVVFGTILSGGNIVFRSLMERFGSDTWHWLLAWDFSWWRLLFWLLAASFTLACLRPHESPVQPRELTTEPARWVRTDAAFATKQSIAALIVVNALFLVVNTVDAIYLWLHGRIPEGVSPYHYIHEGVNNLIVATVLAAVVLAVIFQQQPAVARHRGLRALGHLWIVQNVILAAGVFLRDYLYVGHSQMLTEKRIYVGCFLALAVLGYVFLALHIHRGSPLSRLLWRNAVATFVLFYAMQFLDVRGYSAMWCARKANTEAWGFDVRHWSKQGPAVWPALIEFANGPGEHRARDAARERLADLRSTERTRAESDWRAWQWREEHNREQLLGTTR